MAGARRPEEFDVWKLAWDLKEWVHAFTATAPASREFSFCDEIRRAARSGVDNISEGFYRFNPREFHRFLNDAKSSLGEVRNQLLHAKSQRYVTEAEFGEMSQMANRAIGAATRLQAYLRTCPKDFSVSNKRQQKSAKPKNRNRRSRT